MVLSCMDKDGEWGMGNGGWEIGSATFYKSVSLCHCVTELSYLPTQPTLWAFFHRANNLLARARSPLLQIPEEEEQ
jgi:hypothetical protein